METVEEILKAMAPAGEASVSTCKTEEEKKADCQLLCDAYNKLPGNLHLQDGYNCPICNNKGMVSRPVQDMAGYWREQSSFCECKKIRRTIRRLNKSGLKNIIEDYTFDKYIPTDPWQKAVKDAALRFVQDEEHGWFFIGGASGAGKTHICTAIAGHYLKAGKDVRYMLWRDDVQKLNSSVTDPETFDEMMREFKEAAVLYIDDLFKVGKPVKGEVKKPTVGDVNRAFEILNYRYNNPHLITIISSESMITDILDIDEATGGRIVERTTPFGYGINIKPDRNKNYRLRGVVEL